MDGVSAGHDRGLGDALAKPMQPRTDFARRALAGDQRELLAAEPRDDPRSPRSSCILVATTLMISSPTTWPKRSLMRLNRSMSTITSATTPSNSCEAAS